MPKVFTSTFAGAPAVVFALAGLTGCGSNDRAIVPDSAVGRRILDAAMSAWKTGRPPGELESAAPRIQVIDSFRKPEQRVLASYAVLAETADARARTFTVRLEFERGAADTARYLLVGIDPVLVFREQDYELLTHFEHKMDGPEPSGEPASK